MRAPEREGSRERERDRESQGDGVTHHNTGLSVVKLIIEPSDLDEHQLFINQALSGIHGMRLAWTKTVRGKEKKSCSLPRDNTERLSLQTTPLS